MTLRSPGIIPAGPIARELGILGATAIPPRTPHDDDDDEDEDDETESEDEADPAVIRDPDPDE